MTILSVGEKILIARRDIGLNQIDMAKKVGLSYRTIMRIEKNEKSPTLEEIRVIAKVTNKAVSWFLSEEEGEEYAKSLLESPFIAIKSGKRSVTSMVIPLSVLYKQSNLSPLYKGGDMFKVLVDKDIDGFNKGDKLEINIGNDLIDGSSYLFRDGQIKKTIFRMVKKYGNRVILRLNNHEEEFDTSRFELIGQVVNYTRGL